MMKMNSSALQTTEDDITSLTLPMADDKVFIILTQQMTTDRVTGFTDSR